MAEAISGPKRAAGSDGLPPTSGPSTRRRIWPAALAAGLVATALTWVAGEVSVERFPQKKPADPLTQTADLAGFNRVLVKNAALGAGLQGALLGLILGIAGAASVAGRPGPAALAGFSLGGTLGAIGAHGLFTAYFALVDANSQDLIPSLLAHGGVAALIGGSGGMAFGLGLGGRGQVVRAALGGLAGAVAGAVVYELAGAVLFPVDKTGEPVASTALARFLFHAPVDLLAALGAASFVSTRQTRAESPKPPTP